MTNDIVNGSDMSYAKSLSDILKERDSTLHARLCEIEKRARSLLTYTAASFPYFTPHDFVHSSNVVENLNWLIPDNVKPSLNDHEIFFLIVAAWLHDWGMVCKQEEGLPEMVRPTHHMRTEENFQSMHSELGLNRHEGDIIGRISRGHRVEDLTSNLFEEQIYSTNIHVDVRFLAAALRIADECDITHNRVPELLYYSLNPVGASAEHFKAHLDIRGIGKSGEHKIEFTAIAFDPRGAQVLRALAAKIQKELDHVKAILALRGIHLEYVEPHIYARGFIDQPIAFRLDEARVTQLLIGEHLYSRKDVAIRELLQNSVDACRARGTTSTWIRIYIDGERLVVQDNGIGIDFEAALNFLARKGFSYYQSEEFKKSDQASRFDPISRWGLGFLACFMIASELRIETKREGKDACRFLIPNVAEGWRYEKGALTEPGTIVTLSLNEIGKTIDLEKTLRFYVKESTVPIYLGKVAKQPLIFDWSINDLYVQAQLREESEDFDTEPTAEWEKKYEDDDICAKYYRMKGRSNVFVANQGFYVGEIGNEDPFFPQDIGGLALILTKRDILDLDLSREKIRTNSAKYALFLEKWINVCIKFMMEELRETLDKSEKTDVDEVTNYSQLLNRYDLALDQLRGDRDEVTSIPRSLMELHFSQVPYLILTCDGLKKMKLCDVVSLKPSKIIKYTPANLTSRFGAEMTFLSLVYKEKLSAHDIVIVWTDSIRHLNQTKMLQILNDCVSEIIPLNLLRLISELHFNFKKTPLDDLLPANSHFSEFPPPLRGAVLCPTPFEVRVKGLQKYPMDKSEEEFGELIRSIFILGTTFEFFESSDRIRGPIAPFLMHALLGFSNSNFEITKQGILLFDALDEFNQILLTNVKTIQDNPVLRNQVRNYFAELASLYIASSLDGADFLAIKESEISKSLEHTDPRPMGTRVGPIGKALLGMQTTILMPERADVRNYYFQVTRTANGTQNTSAIGSLRTSKSTA